MAQKPQSLATYGTLRPGQPHHDELAGLDGDWIAGMVRGRLYAQSWGAALGYPGLVLDPDADPVAVEVFQSADLADHWDRLDAFEGEGYQRVTTVVETAEGPVQAFLYELLPASGEADA